ncbi:hypothetical protein WJX73_009083 [Symbiochloris irregularis]|uniref:Uncharacterized protein n=1 Tax=Symbiochloris irregularis TaxID=706552 RepID=A0AAW1PUJ0_9CHLO
MAELKLAEVETLPEEQLFESALTILSREACNLDPDRAQFVVEHLQARTETGRHLAVGLVHFCSIAGPGRLILFEGVLNFHLKHENRNGPTARMPGMADASKSETRPAAEARQLEVPQRTDKPSSWAGFFRKRFGSAGRSSQPWDAALYERLVEDPERR